jgi:ribonuclease Z
LWSGACYALEADLFRVTFLGTGAPRPSFERYGPSILVEAGPERLLVDPSWGLRERLLQAGSFELLVGLDHVLLTHLHFDHTIGLPDLWLTGWLYGRRVPLRVRGPAGSAAFVENIRRAFQWDVDYRAVVGVPLDGSTFDAKDVSPGVVYESNGLKVTAFEVEHMPIDLETRELLDFEGQTLGYRIDYQGRSLVLSGDTRPCDDLVEHARGVDVLVHEVQVPSPGATREANLANVSLSVHAEPEAVGGIFERTRPRLAVYSHIIPPEVSSAELLGATPYRGRMIVAHDLMMITIGDEIEVGDRPRMGAESFEKSRVLR